MRLRQKKTTTLSHKGLMTPEGTIDGYCRIIAREGSTFLEGMFVPFSLDSEQTSVALDASAESIFFYGTPGTLKPNFPQYLGSLPRIPFTPEELRAFLDREYSKTTWTHNDGGTYHLDHAYTPGFYRIPLTQLKLPKTNKDLLRRVIAELETSDRRWSPPEKTDRADHPKERLFLHRLRDFPGSFRRQALERGTYYNLNAYKKGIADMDLRIPRTKILWPTSGW